MALLTPPRRATKAAEARVGLIWAAVAETASAWSLRFSWVALLLLLCPSFRSVRTVGGSTEPKQSPKGAPLLFLL